MLIPGWACSIEVFERVIPAFAEHYRVIAYDPRSQGQSGQTAAGNDFAQRGDDLHHLLQALDLHRVVLLGWSLGVFDILSYLDRHGFGRVASLVFVDESPKVIKSGSDDWGEGNPNEIAELLATVDGTGYLPFFREYMAAGFEGDAPAALLDRMTAVAAAVPPDRAAAVLEDAARRDFTSIARRAAGKVPVMHLLRRDWADAAGQWIRANQPSAHVEVLGGHLMLVEFPHAFCQSVLAFLRRSLPLT